MTDIRKRQRLLPEPNADANGGLSVPFLVNDIALLELTEELDLMEYTPVCLARNGINEAGKTLFLLSTKFITNFLKEMTPAYAYGWGATIPSPTCPLGVPTVPTILQETELRVCTAAESAAYEYGNGATYQLLDSQLCAVGATSTTYFVNIDFEVL